MSSNLNMLRKQKLRLIQICSAAANSTRLICLVLDGNDVSYYQGHTAKQTPLTGVV